VNDTMITVVGNVVDSPRRARVRDGAVTNFRMASTARRYDAATGQFVDTSTLWIDVECWNDLSSNVSGSISKGDPVIVHGWIRTHEWDSDNGKRSRPQIRATAVGHNLSRGMATFTKRQVARPVAADEQPDDDAVPGDLADEAFVDGVDPLTGELLDGPDGRSPDAAADEAEAIVRGRDYVTGEEALDGKTADERSPEPANA
jgi:single-strand DNA-binding protein